MSEPIEPIDDPDDILVLRIGGIGDAVTATPVLRALNSEYPDADITFLAEETPADLLSDCPWVERIISDDVIYRCQSMSTLLKPGNLSRLETLRRQIRVQNYDLFIELHRLIRWSLVLKPMLFSWLSGADRKVGLDTYGRGFFLTDRVDDDPAQVRSQVYWFADILDYLDVSYDSMRPELTVSDQNRKDGETLLKSKVDGGPVIGLFLGANPEFPEKYWPLDYFVELAGCLGREYNLRVLGFAGPEEMELAEVFKKRTERYDRVHSITSTHSIGTVAGFIKKLDYLISADTGPMHMGVALETPTIGIFGPSEWHWYGTYPEEFDFVRAGPAGSENRGFKEPDRFETPMDEVPVDYVLDRFLELYEK